MAREVRDPRGKFNTLIVFNGHNNKVTSQFSSLYTEIGVTLRLHQRSVRVQWMVIKAETHSGESSESISGVLSHKRASVPLSTFPQGSVIIMKKRDRDIVRERGRLGSPIPDRSPAFMNSAAVVVYRRPVKGDIS